MDTTTGYTSNGCILGTVEPGYFSDKAMLVTSRSQKYHGLGQKLDGALFTGKTYMGKLFVKLLEDAIEEVTIDMRVQIIKKSDNSKTYTSVLGSVTMRKGDRWYELRFQVNTAQLVDGADLADYELKFYTESSQTTVSFYADYIYLVDRSGVSTYSQPQY